jgi:hypothetical protein
MAAEVDQWLAATWHTGRAHLSGVLCYVGPIWVMWSNRGLTCGKLGLRWLHVVLSCVSWGLTHCWCGLLWLCHVAWDMWCGQMTDCHVAQWWGPPVRCLAPGWGPPADMDQWERVTWHSCVEVAQSGAATWHSLLGCRLIQVSKLYPESILSPSCT